MAKNKGYLTTDHGDLLIQGGTFASGVSEGSEARRIILSIPGDFKWAVGVGAGLRMSLGQPLSQTDKNRLTREISKQLTQDGFTVNEVTIDGETNVNTDVNRK